MLMVGTVLFLVVNLAIPVAGFNGGGPWVARIDYKGDNLVTEIDVGTVELRVVYEYSTPEGDDVTLQVVEHDGQMVIPIYFDGKKPYFSLAENVSSYNDYAPVEFAGGLDYPIWAIQKNTDPLVNGTVEKRVSMLYEVDGDINTIPVQEKDGAYIMPLVYTHMVISTSGEIHISKQASYVENITAYHMQDIVWVDG